MSAMEPIAPPKGNEIPPNRVDGLMKSTNGKYTLYTKQWKPQAKLRGVVFLSHGFAEYTEYHEDMAQELYKNNFFVFSHDHLGHGRSEGVRGYIDSVDEYVADVLADFKRIEEEDNSLSALPYYLVALSMGGTIAVKASLKMPEMFRGVVLVAPALSVNPEMAGCILTSLARVIAKLFPYFPVAAIEYENMSRDKSKVAVMVNDNLCLDGRVKAKWTVSMMNAFDEIQLKTPKVEWPLLLLQGKADAVVGTDGAQTFFDKIASKDKTLLYYQGAYHNLLQELDYCTDHVMDSIVEWISKRSDDDGDFEICKIETIPEEKKISTAKAEQTTHEEVHQPEHHHHHQAEHEHHHQY